MSNSVYIETQKVEKTYTEEETRLQIHVADNYAEGAFDVDDIPDDPMKILQLCKDIGSGVSSNIGSIIDFVLEQQIGVNINTVFYGWDEIKHVFGMDNENDKKIPDITITVQGGLISDVDIPDHLGKIRIIVKDYDTDGFSEDVETDEDGGGTFVRSEWG